MKKEFVFNLVRCIVIIFWLIIVRKAMDRRRTQIIFAGIGETRQRKLERHS